MKIERLKIKDLLKDPANVRSHDQRNIEAIQASLQHFGQQKPIVVDKKGVIVAGNGTLLAAQALGWEEIDVVRSGLKGAERTAYSIADNRTAELADWDGDLAAVLAGLQNDESIDHLVTGFTDDEIAELVLADQTPGEIVEGEVPEPVEKPVVKTGDLWLCGEHRVLCGDCRLHKGWDGCANMIVTDPPYGVSYTGKTKDALTIQADDVPECELSRLVSAWFDWCERVSRPGAYWFATVPPGPLQIVFAADWKRRGILRQIMVWVKNTMVLGHSEYHYQHEPILFGWVSGKRAINKDRTRTTVWNYDKPHASKEHPTMKPVGLFAGAISNHTSTGDIVSDPFLGSGTTLIAAEQLNRKCYGIEIEPKYVQVTLERWAKLTGEQPTLEGTGQTLEQAKAE